MLDDPVTAQYTHTLTVPGRLGGQYQCNVSNNKPSTDTAQLTVEGILKLLPVSEICIPVWGRQSCVCGSSKSFCFLTNTVHCSASIDQW